MKLNGWILHLQVGRGLSKLTSTLSLSGGRNRRPLDPWTAWQTTGKRGPTVYQALLWHAVACRYHDKQNSQVQPCSRGSTVQ